MNATISSPAADISADTIDDAYNKGVAARGKGNPLLTNPYNIRSSDDRWEAFIDGYEGNEVSYYHHQE